MTCFINCLTILLCKYVDKKQTTMQSIATWVRTADTREEQGNNIRYVHVVLLGNDVHERNLNEWVVSNQRLIHNGERICGGCTWFRCHRDWTYRVDKLGSGRFYDHSKWIDLRWIKLHQTVHQNNVRNEDKRRPAKHTQKHASHCNILNYDSGAVMSEQQYI